MTKCGNGWPDTRRTPVDIGRAYCSDHAEWRIAISWPFGTAPRGRSLKYERTLRYGEISAITDVEIEVGGMLLAGVAGLIPMIDTAVMNDSAAREPAPIPQEIVDAEDWRTLGERLRALSPRLFEETLSALVTLTLNTDENAEKIT